MDVYYRTSHRLKAVIDRTESIADRRGRSAEPLRHTTPDHFENG